MAAMTSALEPLVTQPQRQVTSINTAKERSARPAANKRGLSNRGDRSRGVRLRPARQVRLMSALLAAGRWHAADLPPGWEVSGDSF